MRVVHVSKVAGIAGSERHLLTLLPALRAAGIDARMIVLEDNNRAAAEFCRHLSRAGIPPERVPIRGDIDLRLSARLSERLRALQPDLVHTHLIHADLYALRLARATGALGAVSSRHNTDTFRHRRLIRWLNRHALRHATRVICISQAVSKFVAAVEGYDPLRIATIPYGFDTGHLAYLPREQARAAVGLAESDCVVGVYARLTRQKGVDVLVDSFARLHVHRPAVKLLIVGDGPERAALTARVNAAGLAHVTRFAGWMDDAWKVMTAADVVSVPSRWEGFCVSALEAMAAAQPVVASHVDALGELIIHGESGVLVPPEDVRALADAIDTLLADRTLATRLGEQARTRAAQVYPVGRMVEATIGVYAEIEKDSHRL